MLGGSFWIALLRNTMSAGMMMALFLMLDRPKFSMKKTIGCYLVFHVLLVSSYSLWYLLEPFSFVRYASLSTILVIGLFCGAMSSEVLYLSLYKMALAFYLFSASVFCGVDVARWWFEGNIWVDILVRGICMTLILFFTWKKIRTTFLAGVDYLMEEMDLFSAATLLVSVMIGAVVAYWPNLQGFSIFNMVRAFVTLFMAGMLHYAILHLYIHLGQEHSYQREKELLELNEQFLQGQLGLMKESELEAARIRHDARHHILLIREYVKKGELEGLLAYLDQYETDVERQGMRDICANRAVNSILTAYAKKAKNLKIRVTMEVKAAEELAIRDIDWIAILANVFENAIHGCVSCGKPDPEIQIQIAQKGRKIIICFTNTSSDEILFRNGVPKAKRGSSLGVTSIIKTVSYYQGETDFSIKDGKFITRILLNLPVSE